MSQAIAIDKPLRPITPGTPALADTVVQLYDDIFEVQSPWLGMIIFVKDNTTAYIVVGLQKIEVADSKYTYRVQNVHVLGADIQLATLKSISSDYKTGTAETQEGKTVTVVFPQP